jgi:putative heme transporter
MDHTPQTRSLGDRRLVRAGVAAWAALGLILLVGVALWLLDAVRLAIVPPILALFPAALLTPIGGWLRRKGLPPAAAAGIVVVGFVVGLFALLGFLGWLVANELPGVIDALEEAYDDIAETISDGLGVTMPDMEELTQRLRDWAEGDMVRRNGLSVAITTLEMLSGALLLLVTLFFYVKDGERIANALVGLVPHRRQAAARDLMERVWGTLGAYFRGQLVVAAVDAVLIGIGLVVLGVPAALPLAVIVFFGGLFPIVGAFTAGALAVLVALADGGLGVALAVLVLNVAVQQAEGNLLEPLVVGRATRLHPLVVIVALTVGAVTLGILGAFLAVPVTASLARVVEFFRERGAIPADEDPAADSGSPTG